MIWHFFLTFVLSCIADFLAVHWATGIERRKVTIVAVVAGTNESIAVVVGWLAFVGESWPAAAGMITGAIVGAVIGIYFAPESLNSK